VSPVWSPRPGPADVLSTGNEWEAIHRCLSGGQVLAAAAPRRGPDGPRLIRPRYRAFGYTVDPNSLRAVRAWCGDGMPVEALREMHDGPFAGWREVSRRTSGGRPLVRFAHLSAEYCVDCDISGKLLTSVEPTDPQIACWHARQADRGARCR
jgi:hypothetical protein